MVPPKYYHLKYIFVLMQRQQYFLLNLIPLPIFTPVYGHFSHIEHHRYNCRAYFLWNGQQIGIPTKSPLEFAPKSGSHPSAASLISINTPISETVTLYSISKISRFHPTTVFFLLEVILVHILSPLLVLLYFILKAGKILGLFLREMCQIYRNACVKLQLPVTFFQILYLICFQFFSFLVILKFYSCKQTYKFPIAVLG